jgi:hypothetical protein
LAPRLALELEAEWRSGFAAAPLNLLWLRSLLRFAAAALTPAQVVLQ